MHGMVFPGPGVALALVCTVGACQRPSDASASTRLASVAGDAGASSVMSRSADVAAKTLPNHPDACRFVSENEASRLIGPLSGKPWRGRSADDTTATPDGRACVFPLAARAGVPAGSALAIEIDPDGATNFETAAHMLNGIMDKQFAENPAGAPQVSGRERFEGWDYIGGIGDEIDGRIGHLGIRSRRREARVDADSTVKLMALMRDRIPDLPFDAASQSDADDGDACTLLTRAEVEAFTGPLTIPPYRSNHATPLADPRGNGCSYYTGKHRVLSIEANWEEGKALFRVIAGVSQNMTAQIGAASAAADTLDGPWDQAGATLAGQLLFLKGDRLLGLDYKTSRADLAGALELAREAVTRLAR